MKMKDFFSSKFTKLVIAAVVAFVAIVPFTAKVFADEVQQNEVTEINFISEDITIDKGYESFTLLDGVTATDNEGANIEVFVKDENDFDVNNVGEYTITYGLEGFDNETTRIVNVVESETLDTSNTLTVLAQVGIVPTASSTVNNVADLLTAVTGASEGDVITLSSAFVPAAITIPMPNANITIDGDGLVWNAGLVTVNGTGTGSITFKNITFEGTSYTTRFMQLTHQAGTVTLDNVTMNNAQKGAMYINTSSVAKTVINNSLFKDGVSSNTASAIYFDAYSNLDINGSTFENNVGVGSGYEVGALATKGYRSTLNINNTVFRNNRNRSANTGTYGGGGGAIEIHYMYAGTVNINESYFVGNETNGTDVAAANTYDGGAIYLFDGRDGSKFNINRTTFDSNIAHDDGGAIMFQGTGSSSAGLVTSITDSTFYNNIAHGFDGGNKSGGAIQYFKNGGAVQFNNTITGSTFVGNEAGNANSTTTQTGGAIGLSGSSLAASLTRSTTLFYDNKVYDATGNVNVSSNYKDISNSTTVQNGTSATLTSANILNVDKGAAPTMTREEIFGANNVLLTENASAIKAGVNNEIVKTIPIRPEGKAENVSGSVITGNDERMHARYKDIGAVEISWLKYDANSGIFGLDALPSYDGSKYYEGDKAIAGSEPTAYYDIDKMAAGTNILAGTALNIERDGYIFLGWSTDPSATVADATYAPGAAYTYDKDNLILYAVWQRISYNILYDGNTNTGGVVPSDTNAYDSGDTVTVLDKNTLIKAGYTFTGWNTAANGSGTDYVDGDTFTITGNTTLYAQWEKIEYKVSYDGNGHTSGDAPIGATLYGLNDTVTVLDKHTLVKDGYTFTGWNTAANGSGTPYVAGDTFLVNIYATVTFSTRIVVDPTVTLYAQWEKDPTIVEPPIVKPSKPTPTTPKPSTPATGDTTSITMLYVLLALAGVVLVRRVYKTSTK